ncbi:oligosaccharide flippase family protein [Georgenia sp. M64]|uniref:lipopolysaccharide biosynthesis protein n=1 Tax=Georgenia sp. M64 TaxID=3120520 RepID=UPI0030DEF1C9
MTAASGGPAHGGSSPSAPLARAVLTTVVGNLAPAVAALVAAPILAQSLGVTGRGELAAATAPFLLAVTLATLGVPESATYAIARNQAVASRVTRRALAVLAGAGAVATLAVVLLAGVLAGGDADLAALVMLGAAAIVPALAVGVLRATAAGLQAWGLVARERVTGAVVRLGAVALLAAAGALTPLTATVATAAAPVVAGLAYLPLRGRLGTGAAAPPLLGYGLRLWVGSLSGVLLARVDQVLMTPLAGAAELGLYVVAVNISEVPLVLSAAVRDVTFSADAAARDDARLTASARLSAAASAAVGLVVGVTMPAWVPVVFGAGFAASVPAAGLLVVAVVLGVPGSVAGAGLSARGHPGLRSASLAVAASVNVVLVLLLVPAHGAIGAAAATLVGSLLSSNLNIWWLRRVAGVPMSAFYGVRRSDAREAVRAVRGLRHR